MTKCRTLVQADLKGKRVLLRAGFDVPIEQGRVVDTSRIEAIVPTMKHILDHGASLIIVAHQGRPKGKPDSAFSQKPLVPVLERLLDRPVQFSESFAHNLKPGEVILFENIRFDPREKEKKNDSLADELAALADVYVNDAFTNSHRDHTSMVALAKRLPAYAGFHLQREVEHLLPALLDPRRPVALIISGMKMETKVPVIERFLDTGDDILLGGAIANTFIAARGFDIGHSKHDPSFIEKVRELMLEGEKEEKADIHVPRDAIVASTPNEDAQVLDLPLEDIEGDMCIFDIGSVTVARYVERIEKAGMVVWNGPLGMTEMERFSHGTRAVAQAIARGSRERGLVSILGGGDTIDFHTRYGLKTDVYTFVSMGGGAMLEFISGKRLPALEPLCD